MKIRDVRVKAELILLACKLENVTEACARRGFSRSFFYKWYGRLIAARWELGSLREKSRQPKQRPRQQTKRSIEKKIVTFGKQGYGSPTIQAKLKRDRIKLSQSTISLILRGRKKRVKKTIREKVKSHRRRYEIPIPGFRLQMDVKYVPEKIGDLKAYAYVIIDECTRLRFIYAYSSINPANTVDFLERAQAFFPFAMVTIQTDNGSEFTFRLMPHVASTTIHPMDTWCAQKNIVHRCIPPGEKELNGKVERSHRIDEQCFYWRAPTDTIDSLNDAIWAWVRVYNQDRLHGGIEFKTPYEKLLERFQALRARPIEGYDELLQLRFVRDLPKSLETYRERIRIRSVYRPKAA